MPYDASFSSEDGVLSRIGDTPSFRRIGEIWALQYGGMSALIPHGRGLALLAHLVRHPQEKIHVRELDAATPRARLVPSASTDLAAADVGAAAELSVRDLGDAGPLLDAEAKRQYRRHLGMLEVAIREALGREQADRVSALYAEYEIVSSALRAASGLGGRERRSGSHVERIRVAVTRRIRAAIQKIAASHPPLGAHLRSTIRTGYVCSYIGEGDASPRTASCVSEVARAARGASTSVANGSRGPNVRLRHPVNSPARIGR